MRVSTSALPSCSGRADVPSSATLLLDRGIGVYSNGNKDKTLFQTQTLPPTPKLSNLTQPYTQ